MFDINDFPITRHPARRVDVPFPTYYPSPYNTRATRRAILRGDVKLVCLRTVTEEEGYPPRCTNRGGHSWVVSEETDRCYCEYCGADGDA